MDSTCSSQAAAGAPLVAPQFAVIGPSCRTQTHTAAGAPSAGGQQAAAQDPATAARATTTRSLMPLCVWTTCQSEHGLVAVSKPMPDEQLVQAASQPLVPSLDTAGVGWEHEVADGSRDRAPGVCLGTHPPGGTMAIGKDRPRRVANRSRALGSSCFGAMVAEHSGPDGIVSRTECGDAGPHHEPHIAPGSVLAQTTSGSDGMDSLHALSQGSGCA